MLARSQFETSNTKASYVEVAWAIAASIILGGITTFITPYENIRLSSRFIDALSVALVLVTSFTALLLCWRARLTHSIADTILAASFIYSTITVCAYAISLVAQSSPMPANWYWFAWVLALPIGTILYACSALFRHEGASRIYWIAAGAAVLAIFLARSTEQIDGTAKIEAALETSRLFLGIALNAVALLVLASRRGLRYSMHLWLAVALYGRVLNIYLYLGSNGETTLRGMLPHIVTIVVTTILFMAFVDDFARIVRRGESLETRFEREHEMLTHLQNAFLPPYLPQIDGVLFDASYRPARGDGIGGDWYDVFVAHDENIVLSVGDISGHGWDAASAMVRLRETVRAAALLRDTRPSEVLAIANETFCRSQPQTIATVLVALYNRSTRHFEYASAGHPPPMLLHDGTARNGEYGGIPFGVLRHTKYETHEFVLAPGDAVGLYSDGLIESRRDVADGERRLLEAFRLSHHDAREIILQVAGNRPTDDAVLLIMSPTATLAEPTAWHFRSDDAAHAQAARHSFLQYLARNQFSPAAIENAEIAFGELVGNVVRHAPGPIEIDLWWQRDHPLLTVRDRGPGFTPDASTFDLPVDPFAETGRGIFLVSNSETIPEIRLREDGGTEVSVAMNTS